MHLSHFSNIRTLITFEFNARVSKLLVPKGLLMNLDKALNF